MKTLIILFIFAANMSFAQWVEQNSGTDKDLFSISAVNDSIAWTCGDGIVKRTTNGGLDWTTAGSTNTDYNHLFAIDGLNALLSINWRLFRTTNGGNTWATVFTYQASYINGVYMFTDLEGILIGDPVGGRWAIFRTFNGGVNWDSSGMYVPAVTGEQGFDNSLFVSGTRIWFGSNKNKIYYSSNSGQSFTAQTIPTTSCYSIWFNSSSEGLSGGPTTIMSSINSGANWTSHSGIPGAGFINGIAGRSQTYWFTRASSLQIYKTTNNGETFQVDYNAPVNQGTHFNHITKARNGNRLWAVRDDGYICTNDGSVGISNISSQIPDGYVLSQNYPNPFNPTTNINFDVPKSGIVKLTVYDITGKEVKTLVNENMQPGSYRADFDGSSLSSGVYYYTLLAGEYVQTKKMILVK